LSPPSARRAYPVLAVLALAAVAVPAVPAAAQGRRHPPEEAVERYRVAYDHYKSGRYREAIVELEAALALDPESPTLVYNLARVHELLGELDEALRYYRLYEGRLPRGERREQARIRRAIERIEGALSTSPADPEALTEPDWPGPPLEEPPPRRVRGVADAAVWVTGWTGLALLAAGAVLGVLALDARIHIAKPRQRGPARLAIRPYPKELEKPIRLPDGATFLLRPIQPEDAPALRGMVEKWTDADDRRLRFFTSFKTLAPELCARLTQIDYEREMALVAVDPNRAFEESFCGVVRISADPDRERAEYALLVRSDMKGRGLGTTLMHEIIDYARSQGIGELFGSVLRENRTMLDLADRLGFERVRDTEDPEVVEVRLPLNRQEAA